MPFVCMTYDDGPFAVVDTETEAKEACWCAAKDWFGEGSEEEVQAYLEDQFYYREVQ